MTRYGAIAEIAQQPCSRRFTDSFERRLFLFQHFSSLASRSHFNTPPARRAPLSDFSHIFDTACADAAFKIDISRREATARAYFQASIRA